MYEYAINIVGGGNYNGLRLIDKNDSASLIEDIKRRRGEMEEMLRLGRSIVILTRQPQRCVTHTGKHEWSGTGKNARRTDHVIEVNLLSAIPLQNLRTIKASGKNLEFRGGGPLADFWSEMKEHLDYDAYIEDEAHGQPFLFIKGTNKAVGCQFSAQNGNLLLMPGLGGELDEEESYEELEETTELFLQSLRTLVARLGMEPEEDLPPWSENYSLPGEQELKDKIHETHAHLTELDALLKDQGERVAELQRYKLLYTGSGNPLEHMVRRVFEELGASVEEAEPNRDDLIVNYGEHTAVVEVKGVKGSAAEKHAAQLEKWVSEYHIKYDTRPKGILIVNTFRETPLDKRNGTSFPDQMLPYSEGREHCLVTGLQLFCLYLDFLQGTKSSQESLEELFNTVGAVQLYEAPSRHIIESLDSR